MKDIYPRNILIIDDALDTLNILMDLLGKQSLKIRCAINGTTALKSISIQQPDLILLDIQLPDFSGYDICQHLKQNLKTKHIPVIFISALGDSFDKVKAFNVGGVDYITKPFEIAEVKVRIENQLKLCASNAKLKKLNTELEDRVRRRTAQLSLAKVKLEKQVKERLTTEQAVRQSEEQFRALIENASDLILLIDSSGQVHYASPSVSQNFGYRPTDLIRHSYIEWVHPQDRNAAAQFLEEVHANGKQSKLITLRWQHDDQTWSACEIIGKKLANKTGFSGVVLNIRQITERLRLEAIEKALQQEKELAEMKLRFFAMTSHEFRTPLSVIVMAAQILKESEPKITDAKQLNNLQRIQSSARHLKQMLSDVLDIASLEAKQTTYKPESTDLRSLCDRILATLPVIHDQSPRIHYRYDGPSGKILLDPQLLQSILSNLLSNAIKYSDLDQPIQFDVTQSAEQVVFTVADQGIGIPLVDQANLFDSFQRGSNVQNKEGSGLGLSIVKKCVDMHGGHITFSSIEDIGSTFTVCLPLVPQESSRLIDPHFVS